MIEKLIEIKKRYDEIEKLLQDEIASKDQQKLANLLKEHSRLAKFASYYHRIESIQKEINDAQKLTLDSDKELKKLAEDELRNLNLERDKILQELEEVFLNEDQNMDRGVIIEIRPGTGGEEAALFASDLLRMYSKYIEKKGWRMELIDVSQTGLKGIKYASISINGKNAYKHLRFEGGTHRVQRVPLTEASGRIHTSAATVAIMPEVEELDIEIKKEDLKIETFRAGGPGGQHVNKTASAVRITHIQTGEVATCQVDRSQHRNRELAMRLLRARLHQRLSTQKQKELSDLRKNQIGSGDRSEKIRTYNFPQNRVTDHRINFTSYKLSQVLDGDLDEIIQKLVEKDKEHRLSALKDESKG